MAVERGACVPARGGRNKVNFKTSNFQMILLYFCGPASFILIIKALYKDIKVAPMCTFLKYSVAAKNLSMSMVTLTHV